MLIPMHRKNVPQLQFKFMVESMNNVQHFLITKKPFTKGR